MEGTACVRAVVAAASQYKSHSSDENLVQLQRQLELLTTILTKGNCRQYFEPKQIMPTKCLSLLSNLLNDPQLKPYLAQKVMLLINTLGNDKEIRHVMHVDFNMTASLAACLKSLPSLDPTAVLCMNVIQKISYEGHFNLDQSYIEDLITFTMENVQFKDSELTLACLGVLANLCRNNYAIQMYIKRMDNFKGFNKFLFGCIMQNKGTLAVFSLSILTSLFLDDNFELFHSKNIHATIQLMFNQVVKRSDSMTSRSYVVDLFCDLLKHEKMQNALVNFCYVKECIIQVLELLCIRDAACASKIFELLIAFSSVNNIRPVICQALIKWSSTKPLGNTTLEDPVSATIHWASQDVNSHQMAPLMALQFLRELYEEIIDSSMMKKFQNQTERLEPILKEIIKKPVSLNLPSIDLQCRSIVHAVKLLQTMCRDECLHLECAHQYDVECCMDPINFQMSCNKIVDNAVQEERDLDYWSEAGADVVLHMTMFLKTLLSKNKDVLDQYCSLFKDVRFTPFLAFGLTSENKERVKLTLTLLQSETTMLYLPIIDLGEMIAVTNAWRSSRKTFQKSSEPAENLANSAAKIMKWPALQDVSQNKENLTLQSKQSLTEEKSSLEDSVIGLIHKMKEGLSLSEIRGSEIIGVYEHRLQSLQTKENHLQDLLEAKTLALSQADRLIAEFRCRQAQAEAEGQKMRSLLRESEHRGEMNREQLNQLVLDRESKETELDQLMVEMNKLDDIAHKYEELQQKSSEQSNELENVQRNLSTLKQEFDTMSEMHEMLKRHNETLKQQNNVASKQLAELEDERKSNSKLIKEKDAKLQETNSNLQKVKLKCVKTSKQVEELDRAVEKYREELEKREQINKDLRVKVKSLELLCRKNEENVVKKENALREKEEQMKLLQEQYDKQKQVADLIHSISGGKTDLANISK